MHLFACKALIGHIDALGWRTDTGQARGGSVSHGEKDVSQRVVIATGCGKAKAGNHAGWRNRGQQMKALIPANAIAPADVGLPANQPPVPRRLASRVGMPELSSASYR